MPTKIRNPCCEVQELDGSTLAARLIEIERFQAPNDKSTAWIKDLACLWISPNDMNVLQLKRRPLQSFEDQDYIAVSYSWKHTPILECNQAGKYRITGAQGERIRQSKVRNEVLLRVIRYAIHHKISRFWID
ncbi:hypothetical protein LTR12_013960 [Friedmanniomyces endolithicus]|nr:hypothetical protein LTR12_013960 [Friedmanniomyces endolithicus]